MFQSGGVKFKKKKKAAGPGGMQGLPGLVQYQSFKTAFCVNLPFQLSWTEPARPMMISKYFIFSVNLPSGASAVKASLSYSVLFPIK